MSQIGFKFNWNYLICEGRYIWIGEMKVDLSAALVSATPSYASTSAPLSREALEHRVQLWTFERDQTQTLMLTTLSSRNAIYLERDAAQDARDAAVADSVAIRALLDEIADQARTVHTAMKLLTRIDVMTQGLRAAPQSAETALLVELLARLTSGL